MAENDVLQEPMGIEEKPEATDTEATNDGRDIEGLVTMLEEADVTTTEELQGKLQASREAGWMAQKLGEARKRITELETKPVQPPPTDPNRFESYEEPGPVNIEAAFESAVDKVLGKREARVQEMQAQQMRTWSEIQSHPYYNKVADIFQVKMQKPEMMTRIQSGETNTLKEFYNTVIDFQGGVIQKAAGTVKAWKGEQQQGAPATPNVESGDARVAANTPEAKAESEKTIDGFKVKVDKGELLREDDEMAALDAILGP